VCRGFIARHFHHYIGARYPEVTLIAAGVSSVLVTDVEAFNREAELVYSVLRRCRDDGRTVVFLSTASAGMYGAADSPGHEDGPIYPMTPYGRHKLALEDICLRSGVPCLVLRLAHCVGTGQQPHQLLPSLTRQLMTGHVKVYRDAQRDLLDVRHMMEMVDALLSRDVRGELVNVVSGWAEPVERIVDELQRRLGTDAERTFVNEPAKRARVSTERLRELVPDVDRFGFGDDYLPRLIDRYTDDFVAAAHEYLAAPAGSDRDGPTPVPVGPAGPLPSTRSASQEP
jgi:nucleoside-diphosphate-sugar epimerase